jgi:PAS domain S-box-containing protein
MDYEKLSRDELLSLLRELTLQGAETPPRRSEPERLLHELQVHQIELEMQNRELSEAQGALEESRNRYADLYDFAPVAYCTIDDRGLVEELNLTAATLFGRERPKAIGRSLTSLVHFENPQTFWHHLGACILSAEAVVSEFRLVVDGRIVQVEAISVPVFKLGPRPRTFRTAFMDITRRMRAETEREAAYASEQRLRGLLEMLDRAQIEATAALARPSGSSLQDVMDVIVRHARQATDACAAFLELRHLAHQFGPLKAVCSGTRGEHAQADETHSLAVPLRYGERTLADLRVTRTSAQGSFAADAARALELLAERLTSSLEIARLRALEARETLRLSLLEQVDRRLHLTCEADDAKLAVGEVGQALVPAFADLCVVHLMRDGRAELQRLAHVDRERERELLAQLQDAPLQGRFTRALSELARSRQPHLMRLGSLGVSDVDAPYADLTQTLRSTSLIVAPLWARDRLHGTICFGRESMGEDYELSLLGWAQEIAGRCASALDTAHLLHELREAVQWRENLMAMISHDLKSPLSAISLSAMSMTPEEPIVERRSSHKQLDLIRRSADHMNRMVSDLLSASLLEAGSFRVELHRESAYELAEEACELVEPLLKARSLQLEKAFIKELPFVFADRGSILRVFSNLLGNAAKFTPKNGQVRVSASSSDTRVMFSISDTGPGIPEAQQPRLFERYWKGRKGGAGLGLGLYISKAIVEAHEGRIWLESGSELGARFCFELPRCDPAH